MKVSFESHSIWWHILWQQCFIRLQGIWFSIQYLDILEKCARVGYWIYGGEDVKQDAIERRGKWSSVEILQTGIPSVEYLKALLI